MTDRVEIFAALLRRIRPMGQNAPHLVDLATGHGKFAIEAKAQGWRVTAVDGRIERMPDVPGIEWIQADVRKYEIPNADCISVLGLLYHLELESQLSLLRACAGTPTIVDTHVARRVTTTVGGYEGHMFWEDQSAPTASIGNEHSFWPSEAALLQIFADVGFTNVYARVPWYLEDRTFWLCW